MATWFLLAVLLGAVVASSCTHKESPYNLGVDAYKNRNYAEAATQWARAVGRGNLDAMNNLAYLLYYGYGVKRDVNRAIQLWRTAAFSGESEAQSHLGFAYETGVGVPKNLSEAYAWYRCAVENARNKISEKVQIEVETRVLTQADSSLEGLRPRLKPTELDRGVVLSREYIARYAKASALTFVGADREQ